MSFTQQVEEYVEHLEAAPRLVPAKNLSREVLARQLRELIAARKLHRKEGAELLKGLDRKKLAQLQRMSPKGLREGLRVARQRRINLDGK